MYYVTRIAASVSLLVLFSFQLSALNEVEPNGSFATATQTHHDSIMTGATQAPSDDDYFFTVLPDDGTVQVIVNYTNNSGNAGADLYFYSYLRNNSNIQTRSYINIAVGATLVDTFYLYGMLMDTVYFRANSSFDFAYTVQYHLLPAATNDPEPNNDFASAQPMTAGVTQPGRISYTNGFTTDTDDYFFSVLPEDGTLQLILEWTNTSNNAGSDLWFYPYNRNRSNLGTVSKKLFQNRQYTYMS